MFVMLIAPWHMLISAMAHLLPFRHMLLMSAIMVLWSMTRGLPQYIKDAEQLQLESQIQEACSILHITFITLLTGVPPAGSGQCHGWHHGALMMFTFTRLMAAAVIPLNIVYCYERQAKLVYLNHQRAHAGHLGQSSVLALLKRLCVWTWLLWLLLSGWVLLMQGI